MKKIKDKYAIPMVEVNPLLKKEFQKGRLAEAESILKVVEENGFRLFWLRCRCLYLEKQIG